MDALAETDGEILALGDRDGDPDDDGLSDILGLSDALGLRDGEALADALTDGEILALGLSEGEADAEALSDGDSEALGLTLALAEALGLSEADADADGERAPQTVPLTRRYRFTVPVTVLRSAVGELLTAVNVISVAHESVTPLSAEC